ncbi:transketolase family protein [Anaerolineae bacterium CFX8]|nr:transketolase family protein [Anaerolineae bacterium CFX8]
MHSWPRRSRKLKERGIMAEISMREGYGKALAAYGAANPNVIVLDVDTSASTLTHFFAKQYPERFYNIGIAEPCMIDVAVGLALSGKIPFANGFSALLALRALEQIRTCVAYARTNVKIAASYAGVSDFKDGPTHHSIMDIAIMRAMPEMTVIVPADANEAGAWVPVIAEYDGPVYLRISRAATLPVHDPTVTVQIGKGITLRDGGDVTIIAAGYAALAGMLTRSILGGVIVGFAVTFAENLSIVVLLLIGWLLDIPKAVLAYRFTPGYNLLNVASWISEKAPSVVRPYESGTHAEIVLSDSLEFSVLVLAAWVVGLILLTGLLFRRQDITS